MEKVSRFKIDNDGFTASSVIIGDLSASQGRTVFQNLISVSVDYSLDEASQLTLEFIDPDFKMSNANYFLIGRDIRWETSTISPFYEDVRERIRLRLLYEIASVEISSGPGASPRIVIEARPKGIQQMKRDRNPNDINGDGSIFVQNAANKYGLRYIGQQTDKKKTVNKASGTRQADSVWDVIQSLKSEAEFVCFEIDSFVVFASEKFLLHKWGTHQENAGIIIDPRTGKTFPNTLIEGSRIKQETKKFIPMGWPSAPNHPFQVLQCPTIRRSDQDPFEGTGSMVVDRTNGTQLRPGMTLRINNHPFGGDFLITRVSFKENSTEPVNIEFRTPVKTEKEQAAFLGLEVGLTDAQDPDELLPIPVRQKRLQESSRISEKLRFRSPLIERNVKRQQVPTANSPYIYPSPTLDNDLPTPIEYGTANLWDRPLHVDNNYVVNTLAPHVYNDGTDWVIVCRVWCDGSTVELLSTGDAETKYETDDLHLGKFSSEADANTYKHALLRQQTEILKKRFPKMWRKILGGGLTNSVGC
jgi:hypothetical protein